MKKKIVLFRGGIIIISITIATSFCWQIARLSAERKALYADNLNKENWQRKMEWFGTGGKYEIVENGLFEQEIGVTFADIYSPEMLRAIRIWEQSGIAGWLGWEETEVSDIERKIVEEVREREDAHIIQVRVKKLLKGDSNIEESIGIMEMTNMDQFEDDIKLIQFAYQQLPGKYKGDLRSINIQDEWRIYVSRK